MTSRSVPVSRVDHFVNQAGDIAGVIAGAFFVAAALRWLLEFASERHLVLGAVLAAVVAGVAVRLIFLVKHSSHGADAKGVVGTLALGLLSFAVVCGWVSFTLHSTGVAGYTVPPGASAAKFVDLYLYTFIDVVPGIDVLDTLHLKPPIESRDLAGGVPVLVFKIFVVWLFLDAYLSWRKTARAERTARPADRGANMTA